MSNIFEHKHIVFAFEHYNPLGIVRSLGEHGIKPICIIVKDPNPITSKSKYVSVLHLVDSTEDGYQLLLAEYGKEVLKPFVYTADDNTTNVLDSRYEELKDRFYFYNAGAAGRIAEFQNKYNILQMASKHGINYLKTYAVNKGEIPEGLEYPIITKAIISTVDNWKGDMIICNNEAELKAAYEVIGSERVLLQKYIKKKNELVMEAFSVNKGKNVVITIASTYNYLLHDSYSPYMTVNNLKDANLEAKIKAMLEDIGFEGIFEVELLVDQDDSLYFLEINFRNSTWSYASTIAGMNLPVSWAEGMLAPETTENAWKKIDFPFTAMVEIDDYRCRVKTGQITLAAWIKDFFNTKYYCSASNDYWPVISLGIGKVLRKLSKKVDVNENR